jgi:deoxyribose-phosphate aldolase
MSGLSVVELAARIDASGPIAAATDDELRGWFSEIETWKLAAVAVEPSYVRLAHDWFHPRGQVVCGLISYPLGAMTTGAKMVQAEQVLSDGADEIDVAMDLSAFRSGDQRKVVDDLRAVRWLAGERPVKCIYYSALLTEEESLKAASLALEAGISFLKTNPGYGNVTKPEDVAAIRREFGDRMRIMASGGVRSYAEAMAMIEAGAERVATSALGSLLGG